MLYTWTATLCTRSLAIWRQCTALCVVLRGSTDLNGAVADGVRVVVTAGMGFVAVGDAVASVEGVVVGRTSEAIYTT